jgi:hypothetical protein
MEAPVATNPQSPENNSPRVLRGAALFALAAGAIGSVALMLHAGRQNKSGLLLVLFSIWVLSPFGALATADQLSKRWSVLTRSALYMSMLFLAVSSLLLYGYIAFGPPRTKTAFAFVVFPPASWLLSAISVSTAALLSGSRVQ